MMMALCVHAASWINYPIVSLNCAFIIAREWDATWQFFAFTVPPLRWCPLTIRVLFDYHAITITHENVHIFDKLRCIQFLRIVVLFVGVLVFRSLMLCSFRMNSLQNGFAHRIPSLLAWRLPLERKVFGNLTSFQGSLQLADPFWPFRINYHYAHLCMQATAHSCQPCMAIITIIIIAMSAAIHLIPLKCNRSPGKLLHFEYSGRQCTSSQHDCQPRWANEANSFQTWLQFQWQSSQTFR